MRIAPNPCKLKEWARDPVLLMGRWLGQARRGCHPTGQTGRWFPSSLWMRSLWYWSGDNHLHPAGGWGPVREGACHGRELHLCWNGLLLCDLMHCPPFQGFITCSQNPLSDPSPLSHCHLNSLSPLLAAALLALVMSPRWTRLPKLQSWASSLPPPSAPLHFRPQSPIRN